MSNSEPGPDLAGAQLRRKVIVVGDWVLDENWTVAPHQSSTSTEPLEIHYRSVVPRDGGVYGFCGAGRVARVLDWMNRWKCDKGKAVRVDTGPQIDIVGLGLWAMGDQPYLQRLFVPDDFGLAAEDQRTNPYRLAPGLKDQDQGTRSAPRQLRPPAHGPNRRASN